MKIILSVDKNWAIGKDGDMLFHLKKRPLAFQGGDSRIPLHNGEEDL